MNTLWLKRLAYAAAGLAVIAGFAYALREQPALVDIAEVVEAPMRVTIREEGTTRVREVYAISAPIAGHLTRTVIKEGDRLRAGITVVASIRPLDPPLIDRRTEAELLAARDAARSAVAIAEIELARATTALRLAQDELDRALKLFAPGIISESALQRYASQVEIQKAATDAARATIEVRKAELASAEARLLQPAPGSADGGCCVNLTAPVDGTVLGVLARSEQAVSVGTKIAEIGDTGDLEVVVDLLSSDAVGIGPGTRATVTDWGGVRPLAARVRRIDPAAFTKVSALGIEEQRVNAVLDLEETDARLGHGFRVFAEMVVWDCEVCLQVPIGALFREGSNWSVFVVEGDRLKRAAIEIDHMNDETAEVKGGLSTGQRVVLHPSDKVDDGSLVEVRDGTSAE